MFIEVDDGVFINSDNIFSIQYKSFSHKGQWVFFSSHVEERDVKLADKSNRKIYSKQFPSREEADIWLDEVFLDIGVKRLAQKKKARTWTPYEQ